MPLELQDPAEGQRQGQRVRWCFRACWEEAGARGTLWALNPSSGLVVQAWQLWPGRPHAAVGLGLSFPRSQRRGQSSG